ncbi:hypothetical protein ACFX2B_022338 [Malus domestica]
MKNDLKKSLRTYIKRFNVEKVKIVEYDDNIAYSTFRKGLPADYPLFRELIMGENLTLADSYALVEKHFSRMRPNAPKSGLNSRVKTQSRLKRRQAINRSMIKTSQKSDARTNP